MEKTVSSSIYLVTAIIAFVGSIIIIGATIIIKKDIIMGVTVGVWMLSLGFDRLHQWKNRLK